MLQRTMLPSSSTEMERVLEISLDSQHTLIHTLVTQIFSLPQPEFGGPIPESGVVYQQKEYLEKSFS